MRKVLGDYGVKPKMGLLIQQYTLLTMTKQQRSALEDEHNAFTSSHDYFSTGKPLCQTLYARDFNAVDTADRRAMEVFQHTKRHSWMFTCLMALMSFQLISMASWYEEWLVTKAKRRSHCLQRCSSKRFYSLFGTSSTHLSSLQKNQRKRLKYKTTVPSARALTFS